MLKNEALRLVATNGSGTYPLDYLDEYTPEGISLEVDSAAYQNSRILTNELGIARYSEFLPYEILPRGIAPLDGGTPLIRADRRLQEDSGSVNLWLKDETRNPTGSFKDRGTAAVAAFGMQRGEKVLATISTGNMGHSVAAYAARLGMKAIVFVPEYAPLTKLIPIAASGAKVYRVGGASYSEIKNAILKRAAASGLRLVSGNGPIRTEGCKVTAFELFEQMQGSPPDYVVVPTSACGHIRGIHKGFVELQQAGYLKDLPRMVVAQAANCNPIVAGIHAGLNHTVPVPKVNTIAEAISGGDPPGADEIVQKAQKLQWPAETVDEETIMRDQRFLGSCGFFVEPATAVGYGVLRKLIQKGTIPHDARVVLMLTGSGMKDTGPGWEDQVSDITSLSSILEDWQNIQR